MMRRHRTEGGFTVVEILVASMVLLVALLTITSMFPMGYRQISDAGRMTLAVTGARHTLEDLGSLPFDSIANLNGFDTSNAATLPANEPELTAARRLRYMLAGPGSGFTVTPAEAAQWGTSSFGGRATIQVTSPSATLRQATVTVSVPGLPANIQLSTMIVRMF